MLRGINVSGHNIIKMKDLKQLFETLKFQNIQTYIQSGNIVFQTDNNLISSLELLVTNAIFQNFGLEVSAIVISIKELQMVIHQNPFIKTINDTNLLLITFVSHIPEIALVDSIKNSAFGEDKFQIIEKTIYLFCPNGYGNSKLTNTFFEKKLKVKATTRNWKTVNQLLIIANSI